MKRGIANYLTIPLCWLHYLYAALYVLTCFVLSGTVGAKELVGRFIIVERLSTAERCFIINHVCFSRLMLFTVTINEVLCNLNVQFQQIFLGVLVTKQVKFLLNTYGLQILNNVVSGQLTLCILGNDSVLAQAKEIIETTSAEDIISALADVDVKASKLNYKAQFSHSVGLTVRLCRSRCSLSGYFTFRCCRRCFTLTADSRFCTCRCGSL